MKTMLEVHLVGGTKLMMSPDTRDQIVEALSKCRHWDSIHGRWIGDMAIEKVVDVKVSATVTKCKDEDDCTMRPWCSGKPVCGKVADQQLAIPMTEEQIREDRLKVQKLHPGNRFRLMFGQPLLPQDEQ